MKFLIVRFSSIGDIVLTTPVIRCLKKQLNEVEVHYITKQKFLNLIEHNPYLDKIHTFQDSLNEIITELRAEQYDYIIDLHHNLRSLKLKWALKTKSYSFNKLNWEKFLKVKLKKDVLPSVHIVDRYLDTVITWNVKNDGKGLDYFISSKDEVNLSEVLPPQFLNGYHALVVGGSYYTKKIPLQKLKEICQKSPLPLVLLGGKEDNVVANELHQIFKETTFNACGIFSINQSASLVRQAHYVITSDTGLMHIAAAYKKNIISIWGNTVPEFGMSAYFPGHQSQILEVKNLQCRPCSKLGYNQCPKKHFKCMNEIDISNLRFE